MVGTMIDTDSRPRSGKRIEMPNWKLKLLAATLLVAAIGGGLQLLPAMRGNSAAHPPAKVESSQPQPPGGSSGFVNTRGDHSPHEDATAERSTPTDNLSDSPTIQQKIAPALTRMGLSAFVGLILGTIFRAFLKTMMMITAIIAAIVLGLSYFGIVDIDLSAAQTQYATASQWIQDQGEKLKAALFARLPSAGAALFGFGLGLKKR